MLFRSKRGKSYGIDFNALYGYKSYIEAAAPGKKVKPFGVTNVKTKKDEEGYIGALKSEFIRVRNFLRAESTTIEGSVDLRRQKEIELFGITREERLEQMYEEGYSYEDLVEMVNGRNDLMTDVYDTFHKWKEVYALIGTYNTTEGKKMLKEIGEYMQNKHSGEDALAMMDTRYNTLSDAKAEEEADAEEERRNRLRG